MSLDQGQNDAPAFAVPPQRTPVEFDPESNGLRIGPYERRIADPSDPDQVFGAYISLLYAVRGAQPGEQLKLRSADLEALLLIVGDDPETIEQRLIALMGCTAQEARVLGGALLRHRRLTATLGIAGALVMGGAVAGDDLFGGSAPSDAPRAAVVQSVADGLRALDDAGYPYASAPSAVSPASVVMPTDDWTGSKPVGGTPDVPAGTSAPAAAAAPADVAAPAAPAAPAAGGGDVPAGTPAAPVAPAAGGAPSAVEVPAAAPAAEAPAVVPPAAPPVVVANPAPVVESVVELSVSTSTPVDTSAPVVEPPVIEAPVNEPPVNEPPVIETPVTEAPVTEAPVIEAPVIETPVIETPVIETPVIVDDDGDAPAADGPAVPGTGSAPGLDGQLPPGAEHVPDGMNPPGLGGPLPEGAAAAPGTGNAPGLGNNVADVGNNMPGALGGVPDLPPVVPVVVTPPLPPVVVPVVVVPAVDPTVHDNRDKLKNQNSGGGNDSDAKDRDDNGKHGQTGQHVESGNNGSNSAGGVVP